MSQIRVSFWKALASVPALAVCLCLAADKVPAPAKAPAPPQGGIKTPGVQIPFTKIKVDAEFAGAPQWLFFSDAVWMPAASGDALARIETKGGKNKMADPVPGFNKPCAGAVNAFKSLWVPSCGAGTVARLDTKKGEITQTIAAGAAETPGGIAASSDSVWVLTDGKATLSRIDPESNRVVGELRLAPGCGRLISADNSLWAVCPAESKLLRINPQTNLVDQRIEVAEKPVSVISAEGSIWVLGAKEGKINRLDPKTNKIIKTIELGAGGATGALAFGEGNLWASIPNFPLTRIDTTAEKEKVLQQFWGEGGGWLEFGSGGLWLIQPGAEPKLIKVDPKLAAALIAD